METLVAFGFLPEMARKALRATVSVNELLHILYIIGLHHLLVFGFLSLTFLFVNQGGNIETAAEWILNHPEESSAMELDVGTGSNEPQPEVKYPDGSGSKYFKTFCKFSRTRYLNLHALSCDSKCYSKLHPLISILRYHLQTKISDFCGCLQPIKLT